MCKDPLHAILQRMEEIYLQIRERARQIVSQYPVQAFYTDFPMVNERSLEIFNTDPIVEQLHAFVDETIGDNLGHGLAHATKVSQDAGALMLIEGERAGYSKEYLDRRVILVQCCGLLHDIKRQHKHHAQEGSRVARTILKKRTEFERDEIEDISNAICNHEAFKCPVKIETAEGALLSDCLYDADKFRWGPDNFTHTVWDMLAFSNTPFSTFLHLYPKGISSLARIKETFRTRTGKKYGPQFIDTGIAIGEELYSIIQAEFVDR